MYCQQNSVESGGLTPTPLLMSTPTLDMRGTSIKIYIVLFEQLQSTMIGKGGSMSKYPAQNFTGNNVFIQYIGQPIAYIMSLCLVVLALRCGNDKAQTYCNISQSAGGSFTPAIAFGINDELYVVWADSMPGNLEIYFSEMNSNGTWSQGMNISNNSSVSVTPFVATDNAGNVHVCWWDHENDSYDSKISYRMRHTYGNWDTTEILAFSSASDSAHELPRIVCDRDDNIYVMWTCRGHLLYEIKAANSTWSEIMEVPDASAGNPARLTTDLQNNLHITWEGGNDDILYQMRTPGGTWQNLATVTQGVSIPLRPNITIDGPGAAYIVWTARDYDGDRYVYYACNSTGAWSDPEKLPIKAASDQAWYSTIAAENDGTLHFIWEDWTKDSAGSYGNADIYYAKKYADGLWTEVHNISNTMGSSHCSVGNLIVDNLGNVYIVWADDEEGNFEIFYYMIPEDSL
jgi:hypothetical protein